jgi:hypothetical protein
MNNIPRKGYLLGTAVAILLAVIFGPSVVQSKSKLVEAENKAFINGSIDFVHVIPAAAFSSDGYVPENYMFWFSTGYLEGGSGVCMKAPVYLYPWETISSLYASVYDNSSYDSFVELRRVNNNTGVVDLMASASSSGQSTEIYNLYDGSVDFPAVSYPTYSYYVGICLRLWTTFYKTYLPYMGK